MRESKRTRFIIITIYFFSSYLSEGATNVKSYSNDESTIVDVNMEVDRVTVTPSLAKVEYHIENNSDHDIWICDSIALRDREREVYLDDDRDSLIVRCRSHVPTSIDWYTGTSGHYIRMRTGQRWNRSLLVGLPVHAQRIYQGGKASGDKAKHLVMEIGFYNEDLPGKIENLLTDALTTDPEDRNEYQRRLLRTFGGFLVSKAMIYYREGYEQLGYRGEEIYVPYNYPCLEGEQVLQFTITDLDLPYMEDRSKANPPDLSDSTELDIQYRPSLLAYFFSYISQRELLSPEEIKSLQIPYVIKVTDMNDIGAFIQDVNNSLPTSSVDSMGAHAYIACTNNGQLLHSLTINRSGLATDHNQLLMGNLKRFKSLKQMDAYIPEIEPFELRIQCADHIGDLWSRMGIYHMIVKVNEAYPSPERWCDDIVQAYEERTYMPKDIIAPHYCPSAVGCSGRQQFDQTPNKPNSTFRKVCHYAMNPHCRLNSPPDTVLLFETTSGWNKYGGSELFTFDNHDPKGGCVLLNDGTVKFIRTEKELNQLRWDPNEPADPNSVGQ